MGNEVYANGREVSCKAAAGKSVCAMPDVCMTPPQTPATPPGVPIPYPNTGLASDCTDGSKNVKISGEEVLLKDKSYFKKSTGDEAGCAPMKGVVTHKNMGKIYFTAWSMDVKFEGENVVRHLDMTTHNHASLPSNTPPWPYLDMMSASEKALCSADKEKEEDACGYDRSNSQYTKTPEEACKDPKCQEARKCMLVPYRHKSKKTCCPGQTGHHLVEVHGFCEEGRASPMAPFNGDNGRKPYNQHDAPCVCATSPNSNWEAEHGDLHSVQGIKENYAIMTASERNPPRSPDYAWTYGEARQAGVDAHSATFPNSKCSEACIAAQLDAYHKNEVGAEDSAPLNTKKYGFGAKKVDQLKRGVELIKQLANKRIGDIAPGMFG